MQCKQDNGNTPGWKSQVATSESQGHMSESQVAMSFPPQAPPREVPERPESLHQAHPRLCHFRKPDSQEMGGLHLRCIGCSDASAAAHIQKCLVMLRTMLCAAGNRTHVQSHGTRPAADIVSTSREGFPLHEHYVHVGMLRV